MSRGVLQALLPFFHLACLLPRARSILDVAATFPYLGHTGSLKDRSSKEETRLTRRSGRKIAHGCFDRIIPQL
jgi:hypothetical protein